MDETLTTETIARQVAYANELAAQVDGALDRAWQTAVVLGYQLCRIKESFSGAFGKLFANNRKANNGSDLCYFAFTDRKAQKYMRLYRLCCEKAGQLGQGEALAALLEGLAPAPAALPAPGGNGAATGLQPVRQELASVLHSLAPQAHSMRQALFEFMGGGEDNGNTAGLAPAAAPAADDRPGRPAPHFAAPNKAGRIRPKADQGKTEAQLVEEKRIATSEEMETALKVLENLLPLYSYLKQDTHAHAVATLIHALEALKAIRY